MNFRAIALTLAVPFFLAGCSNFTLFPGVHKITIQQGNVIEQDMLDQLEPGMTKAQVRFVLGTPLIADTFDEDRWDYYYSTTDQNGSIRTERFSVFFENELLQSFEGNLKPSDAAAANTEQQGNS